MVQTRITDEEILATLCGYKSPASFEDIAVSTGCVYPDSNGGGKYTSKALGIIKSLKDLVERKLVGEIKICDPDRFYGTKEVKYTATKKGCETFKKSVYAVN